MVDVREKASARHGLPSLSAAEFPSRGQVPGSLQGVCLSGWAELGQELRKWVWRQKGAFGFCCPIPRMLAALRSSLSRAREGLPGGLCVL